MYIHIQNNQAKIEVSGQVSTEVGIHVISVTTGQIEFYRMDIIGEGDSEEEKVLAKSRKMADRKKELKKKSLRGFIKFFFGQREIRADAVPRKSWRWKILEKPENAERYNTGT
ncbi:hypothetical protein J7L09_00060 [bacterium]|nr:hypothetical protein [bacterium]